MKRKPWYTVEKFDHDPNPCACRNRSCVLMERGWTRVGIREGFWMYKAGCTPIILLFPEYSNAL